MTTLNHLKERIYACQCSTCRALVWLHEEKGADLKFRPKAAGRLCEIAVVAGAGAHGIPENEVVDARREYAKHIDVVLTGPTSNADKPIHIRWALRHSNHNPNAWEPIKLGNAKAVFKNDRFYIEVT